MKALYITYIDFKVQSSGSSVRPQKMYEALKATFDEVYLLYGSQAMRDRAERKMAVRKALSWAIENKPYICYIESPVNPIMFGFDRSLIKKLRGMGIPTAYFVRDCYYKFGDLGVSAAKKGAREALRQAYFRIMYARTERALKYCDIVYFPTFDMAGYFSYKDMRALPPAGENKLCAHSLESKTAIYVGGISPLYGADMMLDAFSRINEGEVKLKLILVCREAEYKAASFKEKGAPWLEVHHTSGDGLAPLYARASVALLPRMEARYNDITVSVKVFEYMSFGLPIAAVYTKAMGELVKKYDVGVVTGASSAEFEAGVVELFEDKALYARCLENVKTALLSENLWTHRAEKIVRELSECVPCEKEQR